MYDLRKQVNAWMQMNYECILLRFIQTFKNEKI